jgi:glucosamine 6-phosphate synthetase-like amidotransferase/phosphosugar isomerase protein
MCGIGGVMMFKEDYSDLELRYIRELVSQIAIENQDRGTHATGISTFNEKGEYAIIKDKTQAIDFVNTVSTRNFLKNNIDNLTTNILIHTRLATQGTVDNNMNNHPIETATTIGVHNGMIYNDDSVFKKYGLTRQAEVDSEAIFRLVDHFGKSNQIEHNEIKSVAESVTGSFTFAFVRKNNPFKMHIVKNDNPITMAYIAPLDLIVFASMEKYIDFAIESTNEDFFNKYYISLEDDVIKYHPDKEKIYTFDVLAPALEQFSQVATSFKENYEGYYYGNFGAQWDNYESDFYYHEEDSKKNAYEVTESLRDSLTSREYNELLNALEELETNSWSDGFSRGRASTEFETKSKIEKAYSEGYRFSVLSSETEAN